MARKRGCYRRRQEVRKVKKERYEQKELQRLKKTLGLVDGDGNEVMKDLSEIATVKTAKQLKMVSWNDGESMQWYETWMIFIENLLPSVFHHITWIL